MELVNDPLLNSSETLMHTRHLGSLQDVALTQWVWAKGQSSTFLRTFQSRDNTLTSKAAWFTRPFSQWLSSLWPSRKESIIHEALQGAYLISTNHWTNLTARKQKQTKRTNSCITQNITGYRVINYRLLWGFSENVYLPSTQKPQQTLQEWMSKWAEIAQERAVNCQNLAPHRSLHIFQWSYKIFCWSSVEMGR